LQVCHNNVAEAIERHFNGKLQRQKVMQRS